MIVRLIKHKAVPGTGSFEVGFTDGRRSRYFYFDVLPSRRLRRGQVPREQALNWARMFARIGGALSRVGGKKRGRQRISSSPGCRISSALIIQVNDSRP